DDVPFLAGPVPHRLDELPGDVLQVPAGVAHDDRCFLLVEAVTDTAREAAHDLLAGRFGVGVLPRPHRVVEDDPAAVTRAEPDEPRPDATAQEPAALRGLE